VELSKEEGKGDVLFLACSKLLPVDPALPWNTPSVQASAQRTQSEAEASDRGRNERRNKEHGDAPEMKGEAEASPTRRAAVKRRSESPRPAAIARARVPPRRRESFRAPPLLRLSERGTRRIWDETTVAVAVAEWWTAHPRSSLVLVSSTAAYSCN
jgi:hypothetical protein